MCWKLFVFCTHEQNKKQSQPTTKKVAGLLRSVGRVGCSKPCVCVCVCVRRLTGQSHSEHFTVSEFLRIRSRGPIVVLRTLCGTGGYT